MRHALALVMWLACADASADALGDLQAKLATLAGKDPVRARVAFTFVQRNASDTDKRIPATVVVDANATPAGLGIDFSRATLDGARAELRQTDSEARRPISDALNELGAADVDGYLNASPILLRALRRATLVKDAMDSWKGRSARLLRVKLRPLMSKQQRKYIKKVDAHARIWLDADGVPLAAEQTIKLSGRALLVVSFESTNAQTFEFASVGDRLVVLRHHVEDQTSGGGESGSRTTDARLTLASPATAAPAE